MKYSTPSPQAVGQREHEQWQQEPQYYFYYSARHAVYLLLSKRLLAEGFVLQLVGRQCVVTPFGYYRAVFQ